MKKSRLIWTIIRTTGFLIVGLMNTVFIKPEDVGSWKNYAGYVFLVLAVIDILLLIKTVEEKERNHQVK